MEWLAHIIYDLVHNAAAKSLFAQMFYIFLIGIAVTAACFMVGVGVKLLVKLVKEY